MHEDVTVSDNSLFFLAAERFLPHAPAHFYFHYYFLYLGTDRGDGVSQLRRRLPPAANQGL